MYSLTEYIPNNLMYFVCTCKCILVYCRYVHVYTIILYMVAYFYVKYKYITCHSLSNVSYTAYRMIHHQQIYIFWSSDCKCHHFNVMNSHSNPSITALTKTLLCTIIIPHLRLVSQVLSKYDCKGILGKHIYMFIRLLSNKHFTK